MNETVFDFCKTAGIELTCPRALRLPRQQRRCSNVARIHFQITYTKLDFSEWGDAFPDNRIPDAATLDRLLHGAYRIVILENLRNRVTRPFRVASLRRSVTP